MKFYSNIILLILVKISLSDLNSKERSIKNLEKKAKVLACSYLSKLFSDSIKENENILKDLIKDKSFLNEAESKEKISQILLMNCYTKITNSLANDLILEITKGKKDILKNKKYYELFELDKTKDINNMKETMKEMEEILKEIKKEEEQFLKKGKDSPNFEKAYKEFEEKMKKNQNDYRKKINEKEQSNKNNKKKKSGKKPYEGTKWEIVKPLNENLFSFKDIFINPIKFFKETGINTISGMIIMSLVFINIFQNISNTKITKESKINKEEKIEENINDIENEEEEKEEKDGILNEKEEDEKEEDEKEENDKDILENNNYENNIGENDINNDIQNENEIINQIKEEKEK